MERSETERDYLGFIYEVIICKGGIEGMISWHNLVNKVLQSRVIKKNLK